MAPTMRIPTVEFRSLLLPPIKVPIRAFRTLCRPQCAPHVLRPACPTQHLEQRRALNLYKTARARTVLGQHKVLTFTPYETPQLKHLPHKVRLWRTANDRKGTKQDLIADNISLQELLDNHVKHGEMLWCMEELLKDMSKPYLNANDEGEVDVEMPDKMRDFAITKAHTFGLPKPKKGRPLAGLKNIIMNESSPVEYYRLSLDRAYQFLEAGCAVEFRIRLQGKMLLKEERLKSADPRRWQWTHSHFPHLRPDFIMKGMPEDTVYIVDPVSDGRTVQWVASKSSRVNSDQSLNTRLFNIKKSVTRSIQEGKQAGLPKTMREQLQRAGNDAYSINTSLPREQAQRKFGRRGNITFGAEETKYMRKDGQSDDFISVGKNTERMKELIAKYGKGYSKFVREGEKAEELAEIRRLRNLKSGEQGDGSGEL